MTKKAYLVTACSPRGFQNHIGLYDNEESALEAIKKGTPMTYEVITLYIEDNNGKNNKDCKRKGVRNF